MQFKHTYEEMLEEAYKNLPQISKEETRFEIPIIEGLVQGNRTIIKNLQKIASYLRREEAHLLRFLHRELATTSSIEGAETVFVGRFRSDFLNEKIKKYCKEFVLCSQCNKPDTKLLKERGLTFKICEACGAKDVVRTLK